MPSPIPPTTPYPRYTSHNCAVATPSAPMANPPDQHRAAVNIAARPGAFHPRTEHRGRQTQHHDADAEDDRDRRQAHPEPLHQRVLEHAESVDLAYAQVHQ